jgi:hypothetical protein
MVEYGLLASKTSDFLGDFFWKMKILLGSMPLWQIIGAGVLLIAALHWLFKSR